MRPAGNSKPEFCRAARTRSLLSFTAIAAKPTMEKVGKPLPRCTSTCTRGAARPSCARLATRAVPMRPPWRLPTCVAQAEQIDLIASYIRAASASARGDSLELRDPLFELFKPRTGAFQHLALGVELL